MSKRNRRFCRKSASNIFYCAPGDVTSPKSYLSNHQEGKEGQLKPQKDKNRKNVEAATDPILMLLTASFLFQSLESLTFKASGRGVDK